MSATQSGYTPCGCRDCMEIAISSDVTKPELCSACEGNCGPAFSTSLECQAPYDICVLEDADEIERDMYDCTE